jgi:hypothetical protein
MMTALVKIFRVSRQSGAIEVICPQKSYDIRFAARLRLEDDERHLLAARTVVTHDSKLKSRRKCAITDSLAISIANVREMSPDSLVIVID